MCEKRTRFVNWPDRQATYQVITENWNKKTLDEIVDILNTKGLVPAKCKKFTNPNVNYIGLHDLQLPRTMKEYKHSQHFNRTRQDNTEEGDFLPEDDNIIFETNNGIFTNSLYIARDFEKDHSNVLRDIRNLIEEDSELAFNFESISYKDKYKRDKPMYLITRDGFIFLAMGFTGEKANQFKKKFLAKFKEMEKLLNSRALPPPTYNLNDPNLEQILKAYVFNGVAELSKKVPELENKINQVSVDSIQFKETVLDNLNVLKDNVDGVIDFVNHSKKIQSEVANSPKPKVSAAPNTPRQNSVELIRKFGLAYPEIDKETNKVVEIGITHKKNFNKAYKQFSIRYKINLQLHKEKTGQKSLDYIEELGMMEEFYAVCYDLFANNEDVI